MCKLAAPTDLLKTIGLGLMQLAEKRMGGAGFQPANRQVEILSLQEKNCPNRVSPTVIETFRIVA